MNIEIELTRGYKTTISPIDSDLAEKKWCTLLVRNRYAYAYRAVGQRAKEFLSRTVLSRKLDRALKRGEQVEHLDKNPLNNTRENVILKISKRKAALETDETDN